MTNKNHLLQDIFNFLIQEGFLKKYPHYTETLLREVLHLPVTNSSLAPGKPSRLILYTDGAARGNPGEAGIGVVITDTQGTVLLEISRHVGTQTNNVAEYLALKTGLKAVQELAPQEVEIRLDSELVVKQITGEYRTRHPRLKTLHEEVQALLQRLPYWRIVHIPREQNARADRLANKAIDSKNKQGKEQ